MYCSELNKTKIYYIAQSDIGGLLPRPVVESALPTAVMEFYTNIKKQIDEDGCNEFSFWVWIDAGHFLNWSAHSTAAENSQIIIDTRVYFSD